MESRYSIRNVVPVKGFRKSSELSSGTLGFIEDATCDCIDQGRSPGMGRVTPISECIGYISVSPPGCTSLMTVRAAPHSYLFFINNSINKINQNNNSSVDSTDNECFH